MSKALATNRIISVSRLFTVCILHTDCTLMSLLPQLVPAGHGHIRSFQSPPAQGLILSVLQTFPHLCKVLPNFLGNGKNGSKNPRHPCLKIGLRSRNSNELLIRQSFKEAPDSLLYELLIFRNQGDRHMCIISLKVSRIERGRSPRSSSSCFRMRLRHKTL